mgnify:CR=1 FL=1
MNALLSAITVLTMTAPPQSIQLQGSLRTAAGGAVDGTYTLVVTLYDAPADGDSGLAVIERALAVDRGELDIADYRAGLPAPADLVVGASIAYTHVFAPVPASHLRAWADHARGAGWVNAERVFVNLTLTSLMRDGALGDAIAEIERITLLGAEPPFHAASVLEVARGRPEEAIPWLRQGLQRVRHHDAAVLAGCLAVLLLGLGEEDQARKITRRYPTTGRLASINLDLARHALGEPYELAMRARLMDEWMAGEAIAPPEEVRSLNGYLARWMMHRVRGA